MPAALITVLSGATLVVGTVRKAQLHADLMRQFVELERQLEIGRSTPSKALITQITDERLAIEATEPQVLKVLDTLCHNKLLRATDSSGFLATPVCAVL